MRGLYHRGREWCIAPHRKNVDLRRRIWHYVDELGGLSEHLQFKYVAAHRALPADASPYLKFLILANRQADALAKLGKAGHAVDPGCLDKQRALRRATLAVLRWIGRNTAALAEAGGDSEASKERGFARRFARARARKNAEEAAPTLAMAGPLEAEVASALPQAALAPRPGGPPALVRGLVGLIQAAPPMLLGDVDAALPPVQGHPLYLTGTLLWCARCGAHQERRQSRLFAKPCIGELSIGGAQRVRRLREGHHPASGASLVGRARRVVVGDAFPEDDQLSIFK